MKIIVTGGSGLLGLELLKINGNILVPARKEVNVFDYWSVFDIVSKEKPDVFIHAAAVTDNRLVEKNPEGAIKTNIIGSANVAMVCLELGVRLVYISTDYVYAGGSHGNYKETDPLQPFNLYAATKLGGEMSVKAVPNHLIIRTSFGANEFPYKQAFIDKWTSKDYLDRISPLIYEAALSPLTGVLNIGTERKTLHAHAIERNSSVEPVKIADSNFATPYDTSLNLQKWLDYKSSKSIAKPHLSCRVCGSKDLVKYLDLGLMPLANNLEFTAQAAKEKERFPLQVIFCQDCALSQLSVVIDPEKMFSNYVYQSGVNGGYVKHCEQMAIDLCNEYYLTKGFFHIDIAGNDGTLLKAFKEKLAHTKQLNVDPASNLTAIAEQAGIPSRTDFWSLELAENIRENYHPKGADLITATNVFAHLDDVTDFILGCRAALADEGILVIENPYLIDFIENMEFDTIYHEHTQYWSLTPMQRLCQNNGLRVIDVQKQDIHGGTMRYIIAKEGSRHSVSDGVKKLANDEIVQGYTSIEAYLGWSDQVKDSINKLGEGLLKLKKEGARIGAFAASAKGATLLCAARINTDIVEFIADQTPGKVGRYQPGTGIPIVGIETIMKKNPDYILILSWNFQIEIIAKIRERGYTGKFIIPIPVFRIVD